MRLISLRAHPKAIQVCLGHSDIGVTINRSGHPAPVAREQITDALDDFGRCADGPGLRDSTLRYEVRLDSSRAPRSVRSSWFATHRDERRRRGTCHLTVVHSVPTVRGWYVRRMVSADEVRHRLLYLAILARNWVRRTGWSVLGLVPTKASRALRSTNLLEPEHNRAEPPSASQPGARENYALHLTGELVIEPHNGWIIAGRTRIVEPSMPYHVWSSAVPNLLAKPSIAAALRRPTRDAGAVVSLRIAWDENYYHFYNDVLGRMRLIDSVVPPDTPVVLSESMATRPYVKACIERGVFGGRQVIAQPRGEYLRCSEVYVVDKCGGDRRDWDYFLDRLDDRGPGDGSRRVLLVRSPERGRALINDGEVRDVCRARGFEVVDTDGWPLADQIELFRDTSLVVGVHGAGLTNVAFRRGGALRLLELIPPGTFPLSFNAAHDDESDYESLCRYFGFAYSSLTGSIRGRIYNRTQNFSVDARALAAALDDLEA